MTQVVPPPRGGDWSVWARQLAAYLARYMPRLQFKDDTSNATENGVIMWDDVNGYPVVSKGNEWVRLIMGDEGLDFEIQVAEAQVLNDFGDTVSTLAKAKGLSKFGTNITIGTTSETVSQMQGSETEETFVTTNLIDSIVSSSNSDTTQTIVIEGHTVDGSGNLTFTSQTAALNGRTEVTLSTPLARCGRLYVANDGTFGNVPAALVGTVSVYDNTDGITAGVPNTDAATKIILRPGATQSQKCATSISSVDYYFIRSFSAGIGVSGGNASHVEFRIEARDVASGGAWRPAGRNITAAVGQNGVHVEFSPLLIVPKNHDVRVMARADSNTAEVFAEIRGHLAVIDNG